MLNRSHLHQYQLTAVEFIRATKKCALFLDMGLGKTTTTLTAMSDMLDNFTVNKVLVIAPLRVANTVWKPESQKWDHLKHLRVNVCTGTPGHRKAQLNADADVYVINRENIPWLVNNFHWVWDAVVIDESSSFKSQKSARFKALKKVTKHVKVLIELTGTPTPNGLMDLWSQMYLIDHGERLGRTITNYRSRFFTAAGFRGHSYQINKGSDAIIHGLIADVCITMNAADYLELPPRIDLVELVELPPNVVEQYKQIEKDFILTVGETDIEAPSAAALGNKLLQISNGAIYDEHRKAHNIHDEKLKALKDIVDDNAGENFLVAYNFKSDLARIQNAFPDAVTLSKSGDELDQWNNGQIKMLLCHPASAGHGLNAQHGGSIIVWFGLNWSLELYQQFNARLHRQGQTKPVRIIHLVTKGCIDQRVMQALANKATTQNELLDYLKSSFKC